MPYNIAADSFHVKKLCSRLSSIEVRLERKRPFCVFDPPLGDLGATYDDHLRLIEKRVVDFLLVFSLGVTAETLRLSANWFVSKTSSSYLYCRSGLR